MTVFPPEQMVVSTQTAYSNCSLLMAIGMFLWVHLIIEGLLSQTTLREVQETLENLPEGLDQALVTHASPGVFKC